MIINTIYLATSYYLIRKIPNNLLCKHHTELIILKIWRKNNNYNKDYHQTLFFSRQIYWQLKSRSIYTIITRDLDIFHIYAILHYYEVIFVGDKTKKNTSKLKLNFKISERVGCHGRQWNTFMIALPLDKESLECRM